jgi:hypothetical protein
MTAIRWSDTDRYFSSFITYAKEKYKTLAIVLGSGDDDYPGCRLRLSGFSHTLIIALPAIIRPWRKKVPAPSWDAATVARLGRDWYWDTHEREYGASCSEGVLSVYLGRQTHDSSTEQRWSAIIPWQNWRFVRHSLYGLQGEWLRDDTGIWKDDYAAQGACPSQTFSFVDFDGEALTAKTRIEERKWLFGTGWFRWLSLFCKPKIHRSLDIQFSGETGKRKGSWKGGTTGHSIEMLPEELHESAFRRYCAEHDMGFTAGNSSINATASMQ